jgi:hypothetical protein
MAATWGWRYGPLGLADAALMRLVSAIELEACRVDLQFGGELSLAGTRSRLSLGVAGQQALRCELRRETPAPAMGEVMKAAVASWRFPFALTLEPLASDQASLLQQAGPVSGALVGEAGLRSCTHGSSGWEWFVMLRLEAVAVTLAVIDPLLGNRRQTLALLPAALLVDWSLG